MAILYSIVYLLASVLGVVAVAIAAAFDYFAWGFVGPLAIMTAVVGLFGSEVEYKGGFVPGGAGASAGASASAASSSGTNICGTDSSGGCVGGSCC